MTFSFRVLIFNLNNMKRLIISILVVFFGVSMFAQQNPEEEIKHLRLGMQVTPTISWFTSDETAMVDPEGAVMGYSIGVVGDWFFHKNYAVSSGVFVNSMGGKLKYSKLMPIETKNDGTCLPGVFESDGEITLRPTYLEIPLGIKFISKEFWRVKFVGQCGINNFVLMSAKMRCDNDEMDQKSVRDEFSALMFGCHIGVGAEYALGGDTYLTVSLLGTMGATDVTKSSLGGIDPVNKLNCINFKIGVIF